MSKYKIGDHVICEKSNVKSWNYEDKTGVINKIDLNYDFPYRCVMDDGSDDSWCTVKGLVEEKKVFTKKDLKTGMFGKCSDDDDIFVVVGDRLVYQGGLKDDFEDITNDLVFENGAKVIALYEATCFDDVEDGSATLIWKREEEKPLYNGKVVCIDLRGTNHGSYTVGKIYQFNDGVLTADDGYKFTNDNDKPFSSFEEWCKFTSSKFIEIKE